MLKQLLVLALVVTSSAAGELQLCTNLHITTRSIGTQTQHTLVWNPPLLHFGSHYRVRCLSGCKRQITWDTFETQFQVPSQLSLENISGSNNAVFCFGVSGVSASGIEGASANITFIMKRVVSKLAVREEPSSSNTTGTDSSSGQLTSGTSTGNSTTTDYGTTDYLTSGSSLTTTGETTGQTGATTGQTTGKTTDETTATATATSLATSETSTTSSTVSETSTSSSTSTSSTTADTSTTSSTSATSDTITTSSSSSTSSVSTSSSTTTSTGSTTTSLSSSTTGTTTVTTVTLTLKMTGDPDKFDKAAFISALALSLNVSAEWISVDIKNSAKRATSFDVVAAVKYPSNIPAPDKTQISGVLNSTAVSEYLSSNNFTVQGVVVDIETPTSTSSTTHLTTAANTEPRQKKKKDNTGTIVAAVIVPVVVVVGAVVGVVVFLRYRRRRLERRGVELEQIYKSF